MDISTILIIGALIILIVMSFGAVGISYLAELWKSKRTQSPKTKTDRTA